VTPAPAPLNIVETAQAAGDFTTLLSLLQAAGLDTTLAGPGPFTVFAPPDSAFPTGADLLDFIANTPLEALDDILTYHVVPGSISSADLAANPIPVTTVQGSPLTVTVLPTGAIQINGANVIAPDVGASNGVIHVIDNVLVPPGDTQIEDDLTLPGRRSGTP
jgi:uncharacterized surface protein with fasciclin (FAS1) repeats